MATASNKSSKAAPLSRGDIVDDVAAQTDLPQSKVDQVTKAYEQTIIRTLASGGEVRIAGFGTFKVSARGERTARNPQTGEPITIAARNVPRFSPGSAFKQSLEPAGGSKGGAKGGSKGAAAKGGAKGGATGVAKGGSGGGSKGGSSGGAKGGAGGASGGSKSGAAGAAKGGATSAAKGGAGGGSKGGSGGGAKGGAAKGGAKGSKK